MWTGPRLGSVYSGPSMWAAELNCSSENSIIQAWSGFTPQYDVGFDKQLGSTNWKFDSKKKKEKKKWEHETRGRNVFAHVSLVNGVNREEECKTLITCAFHLSRCLSLRVDNTSSSLRLSLLLHAVIQCVTIQTPHSVTVAVLTGSLDCLVIQLKQWDPKNPRHISIMLLTERRDATPPGNIRTHLVLFACLLPPRNPPLSTWGKESQFEALLHIQHPPTTHTSTHTHQSHRKNWRAKHFGETGSSIMKANCVL